MIIKFNKYALFVITLLTILSAQRPEIFIVRYEDDNKALRNDTTDWKFHRSIKAIPLGSKGNSTVSFGGEIRLQYYDIRNVNFGDTRPGKLTDENYLEQRYLLHTDLQLSPYFRTFAQVTSNHIAGNKTITPKIDENLFDISQLFFQFYFNRNHNISLRIGRQEILFGKGRLIGFREGPSVRRSYDGAQIQFNRDFLSAKLLYLLPVSTENGSFDDTTVTDEKIFGGSVTFARRNKTGIEGYYLGASRETATYVDSTNSETRHTVGVRGFHKSRSLDLNIEAMYQFGEFGTENINAYSIGFNGRYSFTNLPLTPSLHFQTDYFSGDQHKNDGENNTFRVISCRPISSRPLSFGSANVFSLNPGVGFTLLKKISLTTSFLSVWRASENDYIYNTSLTRISRKERRPTSELHFANSVYSILTYKMNKHFSFSSRFGAILPQGYAEATGDGETIKFVRLRLHYKF